MTELEYGSIGMLGLKRITPPLQYFSLEVDRPFFSNACQFSNERKEPLCAR